MSKDVDPELRSALEASRRADQVFGILDEPLARNTVRYLEDAPEVSVTQLADVLTGWLNEGSQKVTTVDDRDRIRLQLYHLHLPALDALEYVDFDHSTNTVSRGNVPGYVRAVLDAHEAYGSD